MIHEFSRTEMLIGPQAIKRLAGSRVAVFGVGGVGSHAAEALARGGVGALALIDNDCVSLTNINRQAIALHSTVGRPKVQVMKERILDINPNAKVDLWQTFLLPENLADLFEEIGPADYILDAIDTVSAKLALAEYAAARSIPLIASMGTGNKLHPELFAVSDISQTRVCPLCRVMRRELKARGVKRLTVCWSPEQPLKPAPPQEDAGPRRSVPGSISFVPPAAGLLIAGTIIRDLCGI